MIKRTFVPVLFFLSLSAAAQNGVPGPAFGFLSEYPQVRDLTMSAKQDEIYFTIQSPNEEIAVIACAKKENEKWTTPMIVDFTGKYRDIEPFLSPDGLKLYFSSDRPLKDTVSKGKDYDIWYVERKTASENWSEPVNLGKPVNTPANEFYPSVAENGNLYFTSDALTLISKDEIFSSKWNGKEYEKPAALDQNINSEGYEFNAYVSPDESFLIYTAYGRKDGLGSGDLYISRNLSGKWEKAVNLGSDINSEYMDYCPFAHLESHILYFTSKRSGISPLSFRSLADFLEEANRYDNGLSRIYQVKVKLF